MKHNIATTASFTYFGWARFIEAGYFCVGKNGLRCGECIR